jgi:hypothetical protein
MSEENKERVWNDTEVIQKKPSACHGKMPRDRVTFRPRAFEKCRNRGKPKVVVIHPFMKIRSDHLEQRERPIEPLDTSECRQLYKNANETNMRYRWDLIRAAQLLPFVCDTL